jgi:hypothetical protein
MAYTRGTNTNIIVGAAALFVYKPGQLDSPSTQLPTYIDGISYKDELSGYIADAFWDGSPAQTGPNATKAANFENIGYTSNGLELQFQPDFGEVQVDQLLDVAKLYKQGMQVNLNTSFAEATLENLLYATAANPDDFDNGDTNPDLKELTLSAGDLGECPIERGIVAVGPGTGECQPDEQVERIYIGYRALSIENVTVSAKRDEATMFEVSFRMLPDNGASYGKIVDRTIPAVS